MRLEIEEILYSYRIDIVFSSHVHAYERMNRVYNYTLDPCGPVYITIGNGGNIEKVDVDHVDKPGKCPSSRDNILELEVSAISISPLDLQRASSAGTDSQSGVHIERALPTLLNSTLNAMESRKLFLNKNFKQEIQRRGIRKKKR
ncbi:hypothetical protein M9H77_07583 [Catharanthus roseus]|uniref:Uncharacterized protein n=1 Tax=Catharanthus roseus TaxID=4058 RepID=A0ACC0BVR4_CATRO|nr:hypothetical protein M9H77_00425 [Catharanthus roseus]KAI5676633.1 hypothetical protein M9H77_07583 [Catharanthus roseus]